MLDLPERQAPDLIVAEVANVVWKKAVRAQVTDAQARAIGGALPRYFETLHASEALIESAIGIARALRHPVYDCLYLACAMRLGRRLITADRRLIAAVADSEFAELAVHIDSLVSN